MFSLERFVFTIYSVLVIEEMLIEQGLYALTFALLQVFMFALTFEQQILSLCVH